MAYIPIDTDRFTDWDFLGKYLGLCKYKTQVQK